MSDDFTRPDRSTPPPRARPPILDDVTALLYMRVYGLPSITAAKQHWDEIGRSGADGKYYTGNYSELKQLLTLRMGTLPPNIKEGYTSEYTFPHISSADQYPRLKKAYPDLEQRSCDC
jgi:hypothetical protein